jgi:cytoskeleton protein RodZ
MDQDRQHLSFGRYLRAVRLEKGIDLQTVAAGTRIAPRILTHIEEEDQGQLPAEVFVKGFLRAYARQIGVDGDDVVARYLSCLERRPGPEILRAPTVERAAHFWLRLIAALLGLATIMAMTLVVTQSTLSPPPKPAGENTPRPAPVSAALPAPSTAATPPPASVPASGEGYALEVLTLAPTWLKIIVDDRAPEEYSLKAGDRMDFKARSGFRLLIGNAAGVELTLDGNPVAMPHRAGRVVTLMLP